MSISPEAADFLGKLKNDTAHMIFMRIQHHRDLQQKIHKWLDATIALRIASARAVHARAELDSLQANPVNHYVAGFPQFHEWLIKQRCELLRMSQVKNMFDIDVDERWLIELIDVVCSNASDYDLPQLILVEDGNDLVIVCKA